MHSRASSSPRRPLSHARAGTLAALACAAVALLSAPAALAQNLSRQIERIVSESRLGDAKIGVSVIDARSGQVIAEVNASRSLIPASNQKVLTSGAALITLGADFVFRTELVQDGDRLIVRGGGDPALADPELLEDMRPPMLVDDVLDTLAGAVKRAGMERVREIVLDDRVFDRQFVHPSWPARHLDKRFCAEVAGINFHVNTIAVFPRPSQEGAGRPPSVRVQPSARWLEVETRDARTVGEGRNSFWLARTDAPWRFRLLGEVRFPATEAVQVTIRNGPEFMGRLLADRVERLGVPVGAEGAAGAPSAPPAVRMAGADERLPRGRVIAVVTTPIADVLRRCNTDSYNLYAESMLKRIGHEVTNEPGSWDNGGAVVRMVLSQKLGPDHAAGTTIADGSGMSRLNRVSANTLSRWLVMMGRQTAVREVYLESMARPGSGTLRSRFDGYNFRNVLRAKSGYLDGVRSLSGYVTSPDKEREIVFSVIVNDFDTPEESRASVEVIENIVKAIDQSMARQESRLGG